MSIPSPAFSPLFLQPKANLAVWNALALPFQQTSSSSRNIQNRFIWFGSCGIFLIGLMRLFPRPIFGRIASSLSYIEKRWPRLIRLPKSAYFNKLAQERELTDRKLVRLLGFALLAQAPIHYQTAFNANQPGMLLCEILNSCYLTGSVFTSNVLFRTAYSVLVSRFGASGRQNDIGNTRNMEDRREWDLTRLTRLFSTSNLGAKWGRFGQELGSFATYLKEDLRLTYSGIPWKELFRTYKKKETWLKPNPYFTDLAGQFGLIASGAQLGALIGAKSTRKFMSRFPIPFLVLRNLSSAKTEMVRAWQDRTDLDGLLLLLSQPLLFVGTLFFMST